MQDSIERIEGAIKRMVMRLKKGDYVFTVKAKAAESKGFNGVGGWPPVVVDWDVYRFDHGGVKGLVAICIYEEKAVIGAMGLPDATEARMVEIIEGKGVPLTVRWPE